MKIGDIIRFRNEQFFEGAVQLDWFQRRPEHARKAAEAFVFHGPRYHGTGNAEQEGIEKNYTLKDTAGFVRDLFLSLRAGDIGQEINPFWLAVAGYGSGKSHLALTTAVMLSEPASESAHMVLRNIQAADPEIGQQVAEHLDVLTKPVLVLTLDGTAGFHLGNALSRTVFKQLRQHGVDTEAIRALSPRFHAAEQFVERNFSVRVKAFGTVLPDMEAEAIVAQLRENDEDVYEKIDELYAEANGHPIPVEGQESAQELIETLSRVYCGDSGAFSHVVILFDELGRYLEYAAEKPNVAGDYVLQQLFQGVQDNAGKVLFVGFIQYELKAYLKRFRGHDLRHLQRYITRFDAAEKWYLSTNLETIFANMISKDENALDQLWEKSEAEFQSMKTRKTLSSVLPGFSRFPVWGEPKRFDQVIARGCWPLHPFAVWFLTRQRDVVQSRSALTFVKDVIDKVRLEEPVSGGRLRHVSAAQIVLGNMLSELVAAEREVGGSLAETLQMLLEKYEGHLDRATRLTLAGAAVLEKTRVGRQPRNAAEELLGEATALPESDIKMALTDLSELGALEWNEDQGSFELLSEGASRGQFQQWLRRQLTNLGEEVARDLFLLRGKADLRLGEVLPDFAQEHGVFTRDWLFEPHFAHVGTIGQAVRTAFREWQESTSPKEAKGRLIYLYLQEEDDRHEAERLVNELMEEELGRVKRKTAPIWVIVVEDVDGEIADGLCRLYLFDEKMADPERERFRRFISADRERALDSIQEKTRRALSRRFHWIAGFPDVPDGRLSAVAKAIFMVVYPEVIPFPFDGFATAAGAGPGDAALLTRSLIARQVSGPWVQAQTRRLQNRVNAVLFHSWKALTSSGVLVAPKDGKAGRVYKMIEEDHQNEPDRTILDSFRKLIAPPFGMNDSSAAMMVGLLVGIDQPQRRIEFDGKLMQSAAWAALVLPGKRGRHFFDGSVLEKSRLIFLSEKVDERWRQFLSKWEAEKNFEQRLWFLDKAQDMKAVDPLPESLEGTYRYLCDDAARARDEVFAFRRKLAEWERGIEKAEKRASVSHELKIGASIVHILERLRDNPEWSESDVQGCEVLLGMVRELLNRDISGWIPRQICNSVVQVVGFRESIEKYVGQLKTLGFEKAAFNLKRQGDHSIARVEKLQKMQLTLAEVQEYPRQPSPGNTTPSGVLIDQIKRGEALIERLRQPGTPLDEKEIDAIVHDIRTYQDKLKSVLKNHQDALSAVYELELSTEQDLENAATETHRLRQVFAGTRDESDVIELADQLERIKIDVQAWDSGRDLSVERQQKVLEALHKKQVQEFSAFLKQKEIDPWWELEPVYSNWLDLRIQAARRRSAEWVEARLKTIGEIRSLNKEQCNRLVPELEAVPGYLSDDDLELVKQTRLAVEMRFDELRRMESKGAAEVWLRKVNELALGDITRPQIDKLLKELQDLSGDLPSEDLEEMQPIREKLVVQLDQMSLEELFTRIVRLNKKHQKRLLEMLQRHLESLER